MNKTVLITGASSGIGYDTAWMLHNQGNTVIGISRNKPINCPFTYITCDVTKPSDINQLIKTVKSKYKAIDAVIHCAGVGTGGALEETSYNDLLWIFQVNLFSVMELNKKLLPLLRNKKQSKIIHVGSVAGEITIPFQVMYSMSKSSLIRYTEGLRIELKYDDVQVTTVLPGDTKTTFTANRKIINPNDNRYYQRVTRSIAKMEQDEQAGVSPAKVSKCIVKLLQKKKLPKRVIVGFKYKIFVLLYKIVPSGIAEKVITKLYG